MEKELWEKFVKIIEGERADEELENYMKCRTEIYKTPSDEEAKRSFQERLFEWIGKEVEK